MSKVWKGQVHKFFKYHGGITRYIESVDVEYTCACPKYAEERIAKKLRFGDPHIVYTIELEEDK